MIEPFFSRVGSLGRPVRPKAAPCSSPGGCLCWSPSLAFPAWPFLSPRLALAPALGPVALAPGLASTMQPLLPATVASLRRLSCNLGGKEARRKGPR